MKNLFFLFCIFSLGIHAQVGINTPIVHTSAQLHLESQNKGLLIPRLDTLQINSIDNPAVGLLVYNTVYNSLDWYNGSNWVNAYTKPQSPTINSLVAGTNHIEVNFNTISNPLVTAYDIHVQPGNVIVTTNTTPVTITNLTENTQYSITLVAVTTGGKSNPSQVMQTTTLYSVPLPPHRIDIKPSNASIIYSWSSSDSVTSSYIVAYKEVSATEWNEITTPNLSVTLNGLINDATYVFKVKGVNNVGSGDFSRMMYATPISSTILLQDNFDDPSYTSNFWTEREGAASSSSIFGDGLIKVVDGQLKLETIGTGDYSISSRSTFGKDNGNLTVQFNVLMPSCQSVSLNKFRFGGGYNYTIGKTDQNTINSTVYFPNAPTAPNSNNKIVTCEDNEIINYRVVFNQNGNITVYINGFLETTLSINNLNSAQKYELYNVNHGLGFICSGGVYYIEGLTISGKPLRPTRPFPRWEIPTAYAGNGSALIHFNESPSNGGSPIQYYEITSEPTTTTITGTNFPILFTGLTNGVPYRFRARAKNAFGFSDISQVSHYITPTDVLLAPLAYPLNNSVLLQWRVANDAIDYIVEYKEDTSNDWLVFNDGVSLKAQTTLTGLSNGVLYNFRVKPITNFSSYSYSPVVSVIPSNSYDPNCWNHILSSGQSLSIGHGGNPALTTSQPYNNKQMINVSSFTPSILFESGTERVYSTLSNSISKQVGFPTIPFNVISSLKAYGGVPYTTLKKGTEAYNTLITNAINGKKWSNETELKPYLVRGVTIIHGENDSGNTMYKENLVEWQNDYQNDIQAITGQVEPIPMFTCQTATNAIYGVSTSISALGQLNAALENPGKIILVTPKYFLDYSDGLHLNNYTYKYLGEYYGKVMKKVIVDKETWLPLHATHATISGNIVTVSFHVPAPPLQFDIAAVIEQFNKGFEYFDDTQSAEIQSVALGANGTSVVITLTNVPTGTNKKVAYAYSGIPGEGAGRARTYATKGNLCDSDPFPVQFAGNYPSYYSPTLKNWCVTFIKNIE